MTLAHEISSVVLSVVKRTGLRIKEQQLASDANLRKDLKFDSLHLVEIIVCLEDKYGISIPDAECETVETFGDLVDLVERRLISFASFVA